MSTTENSVADKLVAIAENQQKVYVAGAFHAGQVVEYDRFWDAYQANGKRTNYYRAFYGRGWTDETYNPKYDIHHSYAKRGATEIFRESKITDTKRAIIIDDDSLTDTFKHSPQLETIRGLELRKLIKSADNAFNGAESLKNITIYPEEKIYCSISFQWSPLLTRDSLLSIFGAMYSFITTSTTRTITLNKACKDKLTDADIAIVTEKGWTIVWS